MINKIKRAEILIEALPYIKEHRGATLVIKYGGHAMVNDELKASFAKDVTLLKYIGFNPVVVHGGGPQINDLLERLNIKSHFVEGQRFTDEATMDVVSMVLAGKVGKEIVNQINKAGGRAVGLSGQDGVLIKARRKQLSMSRGQDLPPEILDIGLVGEPVAINTDLINQFTQSDFIPVIAPVGVGENGETFNINADTVAGAVASALRAKKFFNLTDVEGVLDKDKKLIATLRLSQIDALKAAGVISGGMIPKIDCCRQAVEQGCGGAYIVDGRQAHCILLELFTDGGCGTEILP